MDGQAILLAVAALHRPACVPRKRGRQLVHQVHRAVLSPVLRGGGVDEVKQPLAEFAGKRAGRGKPTAKKMHIIAIR